MAGTSAPSLAWRLEKTGHVDSTSDLVGLRAREGAPEGLVIWAESQEKGRGRLGRSWISPPGCGLYFSVLLRPPVPGEQLASLSLVTAVAMAEGLSGACGMEIGLKWPNDLRIEGKKVGGILLDFVPEGGKQPAVVAGIGINLRTPLGGFPPQFAKQTTSLEGAGRRLPEESELIGGLLERFDQWYRTFLDSGFEPVRQRWEALCDGIGSQVSVPLAGGTAAGKVAGIDAAGRLLLDTGGGKLLSVDAGEIIES